MKEFKGFKNGINFGGWFSQCDYSQDRLNNFIKEEDFKKVSEWGMDHIRIPVDYNVFLDVENHFIEEGMNRIQKCIDYSIKYNLNMVLDLHKTVGFSFDDKEKENGFFTNHVYQEIFYSIWEEFTRRFSKYESMLAFELLNEVTEKEYLDEWNSIATECIARIRKISPTIKIIVGGYYNNAVCAVKDIKVPFDENIILNFHCYEPLIFTHQGAYWIKSMDTNFRTPYDITFKEVNDLTNKYITKNGLDYSFMNEDEKIGPNYFETIFKEAIDYANSLDLAMYCGEYGVIEYVDPKDTAKWYKDINSIFIKYGIGRALWSYREMDFDFVNSRYDEVREEIISR